MPAKDALQSGISRDAGWLAGWLAYSLADEMGIAPLFVVKKFEMLLNFKPHDRRGRVGEVDIFSL